MFAEEMYDFQNVQNKAFQFMVRPISTSLAFGTRRFSPFCVPLRFMMAELLLTRAEESLH